MKKSKIIAAVTFISIAVSSFAIEKNGFKELDLVSLPGGTFIIGQDSQTVTSERTVKNFSINKYETTYSLWYKIRRQSEKLGYNYQNPGQEGSEGRRGRVPTAKGYGQPVTMISWYDAMVWCNALSEVNGLNPCYKYKGKVIKDSSNTAMCDLAEWDLNADGYRLPSEAEWEYAARYTGPASAFQKGNHVSGDASLQEQFDSMTEKFAWYFENADQTRAAGTAGTPFMEDAPPAPSTGYGNCAGLYDMSGNVLEFCWDWFDTYKEQTSGKAALGAEIGERRVSRGGSFSPYTLFIYAGDRYSFAPDEYYTYTGFRIARNK